MILIEPAPTPYDLRFSLLGISVRVHPLFWLVSILTGLRLQVPAHVAMWVGVSFVSILVHEYGHALMFRRYGQHPRVILYSFGGLAVAGPNPYSYAYDATYTREMTVRERMIVALAGPGAGFLLAILVIVVISLTGGKFYFVRKFPVFWFSSLGIGPEEKYLLLYVLVDCLLQVNILWGFLNLVPVFPLDGGQVSRELFEAKDPETGLQQSLWVSMIAAGVMAVVGLMMPQPSIFMIIMFGYLGYTSFTLLKRLKGEDGWRHGKGW